MKPVPRKARMYFLGAAFLIALPSMLSLYHGHTGKFLVSTAQVRGTMFERTVIYLNRHDGWGAHGIIINKPLRPDDKMPDMPVGREEAVHLMRGGPVSQDHWYYLKSGTLELAGYDALDPNSSFPDDLTHVYAGYAGWAPFQLNLEIVRGTWAVIDYDPSLMFDTRTDDVWNKAIEKSLQERPAALGGI